MGLGGETNGWVTAATNKKALQILGLHKGVLFRKKKAMQRVGVTDARIFGFPNKCKRQNKYNATNISQIKEQLLVSWSEETQARPRIGRMRRGRGYLTLWSSSVPQGSQASGQPLDYLGNITYIWTTVTWHHMCCAALWLEAKAPNQMVHTQRWQWKEEEAPLQKGWRVSVNVDGGSHPQGGLKGTHFSSTFLWQYLSFAGVIHCRFLWVGGKWWPQKIHGNYNKWLKKRKTLHKDVLSTSKKQWYDRKTGGWLVGGYSNRNSKWKPQSWVKLKKLWKFKTTLRTEEQMRSWGTWTVTAIFRTCEYVWCLSLYKKKEKCSERRQPPTYGRVCVATPTSKCIGQSRGALYRNAPGNPITWFQPQTHVQWGLLCNKRGQKQKQP